MKIFIMLFSLFCFSSCAHQQSVFRYKFTCPNTGRIVVIDITKEELENPAAGLYDRVIAKCKEIPSVINNKVLEYKNNWFNDYHMECVK